MSGISIKHKIKESLPKPLVNALITLKYFGSRLPNAGVYVDYVIGKKGIEIGGPSILFKTTLPLYQNAGDLDGVNFSADTIWEGHIQIGRSFNYIGKKKGLQFTSEATDLSQIPDGTYDFVLSSNCLEHVANPIKALLEWKRIMKANGCLVLVLPNKVSNFDHNRPTTSFEHLLEDFDNGVTEHDLTHLDEILALHDLSMDPPAGSIDNFRTRSLNNIDNRTLHHHVFDLNVMTAMLHHAGFEVVETNETRRDFFALAKRSSKSPSPIPRTGI